MVGRAGQPQGWPALYRYSYPRSVCHPSVGRWVAVHYRYWIEHTMNAIPQGASAPAVESLSVITYQQQPVITTELLAKLYGTDAHNIRKNFFSNADRFIAGKHFIKLEGAALREFKHSITESDSVKIARNVNSLLLWTERGAARHAKMLDTEQAWEVFEKLEDCYFSVKAAPVALAAPVPTLSKELRGHIHRTAHAIALRQYDTIHAILTDCATDNLACGATEQACVGYVDAYADLADGTVLINIRDAQEIVHAVGQVIDQAGSAIAAIRRIEQRSGFNLYPRIKRNEWDNQGFHKHDRLVQEVIDRITGEAE